MNFEQLSESLQSILIKAIELAKANRHAQIDTIECLEAIFQDTTLDGLWKRIDLNKQQVLNIIEEEKRYISLKKYGRIIYNEQSTGNKKQEVNL